VPGGCPRVPAGAGGVRSPHWFDSKSMRVRCVVYGSAAGSDAARQRGETPQVVLSPGTALACPGLARFVHVRGIAAQSQRAER